jgi:hypothetical protein
LLTVTYDTTSAKSKKSERHPPYLPLMDNPGYGPILYVTSDEARGDFLPAVSWADAARWEQLNFPYSVVGYWASAITPKPGVQPAIEDINPPDIEMDLMTHGTHGLPETIPGLIT